MGETEDADVVEGVDEDVEQGAAIDAPFDPIIAERLDVPESPEAIYEDEASVYRPISTGDLFHGAQIEGWAAVDAPHDLVMIVAHPSAMRDGATLKPRLRAAPVVPVNGVSSRKWTPGFYDIFPLPKLCETAELGGLVLEKHGWAALLNLSAPVSTDSLNVQRRFACLSPDGIHLLLQRLVHADTRVPVNLKTLAATFAPKLVELDMLLYLERGTRSRSARGRRCVRRRTACCGSGIRGRRECPGRRFVDSHDAGADLESR